MSRIHLIPIINIPIINNKIDVDKLISHHIKKGELHDSDIIVCCHTIISKAEGMIYNLDKVRPSEHAKNIAKYQNKHPGIIEIILRNTKRIVRVTTRSIISETHHGFICANAGCDQSNTPDNTMIALPKNPDKSAQRIRETLQKEHNIKKLAVIISDSFGRPHRKGTTNIAIGVSGIEPILMLDKTDIYGRKLKATYVAIVDQLASAAGLIMGESDEAIPVVIIRGVEYMTKDVGISQINRNYDNEIFR